MPTASPFIAWFMAYRYAMIYPLAIVEGPVVSIISGFLVRTGFFAFWPAYFLLMAGDLTGDVLWYTVGRLGARPLINRYGRFLSLDADNVDKLESLFHKHQTKILFISKLTTGFGFAIATLVAAGAAKVSFKKYFAINFFGQFIWTGILMAVGYFLGNLYALVDKSLRWGFVAGIIIVGFLAVYGFGRAMKKRLGEKLLS
jgi:membrane protein DedA with SNARE-associated domain